MEIRQATLNDLDNVLALHRKYHIASIDEKEKSEGFVTTNFTQKQLENLVNIEDGITIAIENNSIVSYAMAASWAFWSEWPLFAHMIQILPNSRYKDQILTMENSYQYGPMCVDSSFRGTGLFERVFFSSLEHMASRYPIMVTFINQINHRSYAAHIRKALMDTVGTFQYNNNDYYMLACLTKH
jgi:hypothetical protein